MSTAFPELALDDNAYASLFFVITGFHGLHVVVGLLMSIYLQLRVWKGHFSPRRYLAVQNVGLYWHFVDVVWLFVLLTVYITPNTLTR
ncbi:MAG: cytochrome c oxidase subunit 3 [Thermomicrobiales bacterium]